MFDKAEAEFKALQEKRRIVLNDRHKIEAVINELDEKKREALEVTWNKVNADFGKGVRSVVPPLSPLSLSLSLLYTTRRVHV